MLEHQAANPAAGGLFAVSRLATAYSGVPWISSALRSLPRIPCNIYATLSRPEFLGMFMPQRPGSTPRSIDLVDGGVALLRGSRDVLVLVRGLGDSNHPPRVPQCLVERRAITEAALDHRRGDLLWKAFGEFQL